MVKAGTLPPLNERLPEIPLMLPVVDEIGQYGGTLRRAFLGPGDHNNYTRAVYDALVRYAPDGSQIVPHIAAGWESNENFTEWIIRLRPGAKWSDGTPFTADDIMFWYDNILMNQELMPGGVDEKWRWFDGFCSKAFGLFSQVDLQATKYSLPAKHG
jgi:peptide/nickel transport system substrate-binding protein